jgi:hypothetical protein
VELELGIEGNGIEMNTFSRRRLIRAVTGDANFSFCVSMGILPMEDDVCDCFERRKRKRERKKD